MTPFPARIIGFANDAHNEPVALNTDPDQCATCRREFRPGEVAAVSLTDPAQRHCRKCATTLAAQRVEIPDPEA